MDPKFIFVTGGVVSSLGKGITAASLGRLLKSRPNRPHPLFREFVGAALRHMTRRAD